MTNRDLDFQLASELFTLSQGELGGIIWRARPGCTRNDKEGKVAASKRRDGYTQVQVFSKRYLVHRVVWLLAKGDWPNGQIDHINRVRDDNRLENLRPVSALENAQNTKRNIRNKSGCKGVFAHSGGYEAYITKGHVRYYLGFFKTFDAAKIARARAHSQMFTHGGAL